MTHMFWKAIGAVRSAWSVPGWAVGAVAACLVLAPAALAQTHILNLRNADIQALIEDVTAVTNNTFIVHPAVKGKVNVTSQTPLTEDEVFEVFLSTLRVLNYTVIPTNTPGVYRVVPDSTAAEDNPIVGAGGRSSDQFATEVIRLRTFSAVEAAKMITPLVNGRGKVSANPDGNILIVVDYASNIERIRRILNDADRDESVVRTVRLRNMPATEAARILNSMDGQTDRRNAGGGGNISAVAVESGNTILIRGEVSQVRRAEALALQLDEANEPSESLRVVYLKHAEAKDVVPILEAVAASLRTPGQAGGESNAVKIPYDEATNALVLSADPNTIGAMMRVVEYLDIRRAQVQVEAIIVEITDNTARELGLEFFLAGEEGSGVPFASTSFSNSAQNILLFSGAVLDADGDGAADSGSDNDNVIGSLTGAALGSLLGVEGLAFGFAGELGDGSLFNAILNAVQADTRSNLLSTPSITMLDNEEGSILVGQEIPITTGASLGADNGNPFVTTQREDVGVQLQVRPQISEGGAIKLYIRQEVSSIAQALTTDTSTDFITNKREVETTVLADDGEIIVLGGLIESNYSQTDTRIPLLGSIPVLGRLFRSEGRSNTRTNLVVFIRPTILRTSDDIRAATAQKYRYINSESERVGGGLDSFLRDVLDAEPPRAPGSRASQ